VAVVEAEDKEVSEVDVVVKHSVMEAPVVVEVEEAVVKAVLVMEDVSSELIAIN